MTDEQAQHVIRLLTEIRDLLTPPDEAPELLCEHPENRRINLSAMGREEWRCKDCGLHVRNGESVT